MSRQATGGTYERLGKFYARVAVSPTARKHVGLATCSTKAQADARARVIGKLVRKLRSAGQEAFAVKAAEQAAVATPEKLVALSKVVDGICKGTEVSVARLSPLGVTFKVFAERWTSGELHRQWPDHVGVKRTADEDIGRLTKHVYPHVGDVPLTAFRVEHAEAVMRALPESASPATRRYVAQLLRRVLKLAVYPARLLEHSPFPPGFLPRLGTPKRGSCTPMRNVSC